MSIPNVDAALIPQREHAPALNSGVGVCFGSRPHKAILKNYFALEKSDRNVPVTEKSGLTCRDTALHGHKAGAMEHGEPFFCLFFRHIPEKDYRQGVDCRPLTPNICTPGLSERKNQTQPPHKAPSTKSRTL